ncbi:hypothetical protein D1164_20580 [Mariniphaga sediminis]|uniref:DUF6922 domain-containing protein n=2 Tax=Mariniphaga sediminis TaxID=1628158 RepID=A0A399CXX9_9BACT|nr:hypothetical protein D1164_20580 [Mariniphaga sediminis]
MLTGIELETSTMSKKINIIPALSKHLFWDTDPNTIHPEKHSKYIISNVLQYGNYSDWKTLVAYYGLEQIVKTAQTIKNLDKRTASFLSVMGDIPKTNFQCYSTTPSSLKHWFF